MLYKKHDINILFFVYFMETRTRYQTDCTPAWPAQKNWPPTTPTRTPFLDRF